MNIQAIMKQAQAMQKDMTKIKNEVENTDYTSENSMIKITMKGSKKITKVELKVDSLDKEDVEMLEDMIVVAVNDTISKIDKDLEKKMGKFGNIPGLF